MSPNPQTKLIGVGPGPIAQVVAIGLARSVVLVPTVLLLRNAVDALIVNVSSTSTFLWIIGALAALGLAGAGLRSLQFSVSESIGYDYVRRLRMVMYTHLQGMEARQLLNTSRGAILLRFLGDLNSIRTWVSRGIARAIVASIFIIAALATLIYINPLIAAAVTGVLLIGAGLSVPAARKVRKASRLVRRQRANLSMNLTEQIHSMGSVQTLGRASGEYDRLDRQNQRLTNRLVNYAWRRGALRIIPGAAGSLAVVSVLAVGAIEVNAGRVSVGSVAAAMILARLMITPVRELGLAFDYVQAARVSQEKIRQFLCRPCRQKDGSELPGLQVQKGCIEFRDVSIHGCLKNVTATAGPNQIIALVGPNGSGKSSMLAAVSRLIDPDGGQVLVDDQPIAECSTRSCSREISLMSPALPLLRGSIRRNLLYRWRTAPDSELQRVIGLCGLEDLIANSPHGLLSTIKEGGTNLSSGQRMRIMFARAIVGSPKILLLDDPFNGIDQEGVEVLRQVLLHYRGTVIIATHNAEDAAMADVVWRMEDGHIVEQIPGCRYEASLQKDMVPPGWSRAGALGQ
ncbi:MAG: ABC transporter ATP-binding protein [Thermoleophilia bacterium]|jgi:ABC-type multidrug transport system fused ATPase/permease subunit